MDKRVYKYESIFIVDARLTEDDNKALIEKFTSLITKSGNLIKVDEWGKRKLAYPINDLTEGYYVRMEFECDAQLLEALEHQYRITEGVMRSIVVRMDK